MSHRNEASVLNMICVLRPSPCNMQGCTFSDFILISDFVTKTHLKMIYEISSLEHVLHDLMICLAFQIKP